MSFRNELHVLLWHMWQGLKSGDLPYVLIGVRALPGALYREIRDQMTEMAARHLQVAEALLTGDWRQVERLYHNGQLIESFGLLFFLGALAFRLSLFLLPPLLRLLEPRRQARQHREELLRQARRRRWERLP